MKTAMNPATPEHASAHPVTVAAPPRAPGETAAYAAAAAVFAATVALTLYFARSMGGGMRMAGGWTMSMMWMRMPGQSWAAATVMFMGMWLAMMVAMMLPSSLPMLLVYRRAAFFRGQRRVGWATALLAGGYFGVWLLFGAVAYGAGLTAAAAAMRWESVSRAVPMACGLILIVCGVYQFTGWKSNCLKHCRDPLTLVASNLHRGLRGALELGIHHGLSCAVCCASLMVMQLVLGVMDLRLMAAIAIVIAVEKLLPAGLWIAKVVGIVAILGGLAFTAAAFTHGLQSS